MILEKNRKFSLLFVCLFVCFFNKISLKIMPHDHLVRKQALKYYKKWILNCRNIGIFSERFTHSFGQKMKILSLFVFGQNRPGNSVLRIFEEENKPS